MQATQEKAAAVPRERCAEPMGLMNDIDRIRGEFPALHVKRNGQRLIYFDNAATSHKPQAVIGAVSHYYEAQNSNVHRGVHHLSQVATEAYEGARLKLQEFINAQVGCQVIFTRGATESINIIAQSFGHTFLREGDEVLLSNMEHHSNIVPWQILRDQIGIVIKVIPINDDGEIIQEEYEKLLTERTKLVGIVQVSNALGTVNPVKEMIAKAHAVGAKVLVDGAQAVQHVPVDVQDLDCDFYVGSAHKMFGPTGTGFLYGKASILNDMPPVQGGGDMILRVTFDKTTYNELPYKFEAGTPNIAGVVGLGAAIDYVKAIGMNCIEAYEHELTTYATERLSGLEGVRIIGTTKNKASVISFTMDCAHPHDIGQIFDDLGVAIRVGHHCAQPVMDRFGIPATARISLAFYNTKEEIDVAVKAIERVKEVFA
jgi:cysteine desulfurase/selenocysteine lyase